MSSIRNAQGAGWRSPSLERSLLGMLLAGASPLVLAGHAVAQEAEAAQPADLPDSGQDDAGAAGDEAIIVTGSRIQRGGFDTPTPVTAMSEEALQARAPTNIADGLNTLPQFMNSASNTQSRSFSATATPQGNYLNLRGLGSKRSLMLFDGKRLPPTDQTGGVDINTLPQMLVKRVDVVTGGASAAYGSDAVVGVVNFILDRNFTGVKATAQAGISSRGDNGSYKLGAAFGKEFAEGRGHLLLSAERFHSDGIDILDRKLGSKRYLLVGNGTKASPFTTVEGARYNSLYFGGLIASGPLAGMQFRPDGSVVRANPGTVTGTPSISTGGDGGYVENTSANSELLTNQFFGRLSYEVSPSITAHVQAMYAEAQNGYTTSPLRLAPARLTIFSDNAFLTPAVKAALGATPNFRMGVIRRDIPLIDVEQLSKSLYVNTGLEGDLGGGWSWDADYSYGRTNARTTSVEMETANFYAGVDAVRDPLTDQIVCRVTLTNPGLYPGCVPINLIGDGNVSAEAVDWLNSPSVFNTINTMHIVSANIRGEPFSTWAGPVSIAFGGEYRSQKLVQTTNSDPAASPAFTGIRGVPAGSNRFITLNIAPTRGSVEVKEAYVETVVPLARDLPGIRALDLNAAVRLTDYSTSGRVTTWKVGATYQPFEDLRLRGTYSRDIAAPSLGDLFRGGQSQLSATTARDPHTGTNGQYLIVSAGNLNLVPETGTMLVGGIVYQPGWLPGFSLSIDAYSLRLKNALTLLDQDSILTSCENSNGTAPACALITRPGPYSDRSPANFPTAVRVAPLNLAEIKRQGIDFEVAYRTPLDRLASGLPGSIELRGFASYIAKFTQKDSPESPMLNIAGGLLGSAAPGPGFPRWTGSLQLRYAVGGFAIDVIERWTGSYDRGRYLVFANPDEARTPNYVYTDLQLTYDVPVADGQRSMQAFLSIKNLFDKKPPILAGNANPGLAYPTQKAFYDIVGTYATIGVRVKM